MSVENWAAAHCASWPQQAACPLHPAQPSLMLVQTMDKRVTVTTKIWCHPEHDAGDVALSHCQSLESSMFFSRNSAQLGGRYLSTYPTNYLFAAPEPTMLKQLALHSIQTRIFGEVDRQIGNDSQNPLKLKVESSIRTAIFSGLAGAQVLSDQPSTCHDCAKWIAQSSLKAERAQTNGSINRSGQFTLDMANWHCVEMSGAP